MAGRPKGLPKTGGRKPGQQNHLTLEVKHAVALVAEKLGGVDRLLEWARSSEGREDIFWERIYCKLIPVTLGGDPNNPVLTELIMTYRPNAKE